MEFAGVDQEAYEAHTYPTYQLQDNEEIDNTKEKGSGAGAERPNWSRSAHRNLEIEDISSVSTIVFATRHSSALLLSLPILVDGPHTTGTTPMGIQRRPHTMDHGVAHEAHASSDCTKVVDNGALVSSEIPDMRDIPDGLSSAYSQATHDMSLPLPDSPIITADCSTAIGKRAGDETARGVGTAHQVTDPHFERSTTARGDEVALVSERDSISLSSNTEQIIDGWPPSSPKDSASVAIVRVTSAKPHVRGLGIEAPTSSTLGQQRLLLSTTPEPRSDHGGASLVFHDGHPRTPPSLDTAKQTQLDFDSMPHSSPIPNSSQLDPEMRPNTPFSSAEAPALASPVELESNLRSTPPSSPVKSSPPPLKLLKKVTRRLGAGLGAAFKSPFRRPIPCALPSSPLPPSSPPLATSSPQGPPAKKRRAGTPPEDQPVPPKVRRTGPSPFPPFISPLRNPQDGTKSRTRAPAGGFSTPIRPSRIQYDTFSSPIMPREPDVFMTPATAEAAAYRLSIPLSSDPVLDDVDVPPHSSTMHKLCPPRGRVVAVARPFKPPAKSSRPTSVTVQGLKQRLQSLRNALRIRGIVDPTRPDGSTQTKKPMDDNELEALAVKWRDAARDAAHDLWALAKDSSGEDSWGSGEKNKDDWGWNTKPQRGYPSAASATEHDSLEGAETESAFTPSDPSKASRAVVRKLRQAFVPRKTILPPHEDSHKSMDIQEYETGRSPREEGETKAHTLGTMLTSLGIPHEVLGWQEDEGEFVD